MHPTPQKASQRQNDQPASMLSSQASELADGNALAVDMRMLFEAMLDNIPDRIYFKDLQSRFLKINKALADRLGLSNPDDAIGKTDFDFNAPEMAREFFTDEQSMLQTGEPLINKIEKKVLPNGETAWTSTTKVPLRNREGAVVGIVGINRDISDLKAAEQKIEAINRELREASRQAGMAEVATGVLHNVGNVLNSVNVAAGVLSDRLNHSKSSGVTKLSKLLIERQGDLSEFLSADERGRAVPAYLQQLSEHLEKEQADMRRELNELVMNVEHIKEIVATQQNYARVLGVAEVVDLSEVLEDAIKIHGGAYERHGIKLIRQYDAVPQTAVDKHKVMQIVINFLANAKYACDAGEKEQKTVAVRIKRVSEERVKIEVADNGIGIAPENLTRIFSQGFTTRKGGHGFGLHSGALAAKELGGVICAESQGIGQGATFSLELPIVLQSGGQKS
ncbi:MAG TPA: ATP-binding protein [Verrucomicrobiae bacterium]